MNRRSDGQNAQDAPPTATPRARQAGPSLAAVRFGATIFAALAGIACYVGIVSLTTLGTTAAFIIGLVFALLTRTAAAGLARDWLVRSAENRRRDESE